MGTAAKGAGVQHFFASLQHKCLSLAGSTCASMTAMVLQYQGRLMKFACPEGKINRN